MAEKEKKPSRLVNWLAEHPMRACVIVLSVIAMAAGLLLGGINELTYQSPEEKLAKNLNKAYATEGTWENVSLEGITVNSKDKSVSVTGAYKNENGADVVYIYTTTSKGYKSGLELMVVVKNDKIIKIMKTSSNETLGVENNESFLSQFYNIDLTTIEGFRTNKQKTDGTEVNAVSSATKTSNAVASSVDLVVGYHKAIAGGAK